MSKYRARDAPLPGSSVSETHPGFWADCIRKEKIISDKWYQEYGHFYYNKSNFREEPYYGPIFAPVPQIQETHNLEGTTVSPAEPLAYLRHCIKVENRLKSDSQNTQKEELKLMYPSDVPCDCNNAGMQLKPAAGQCYQCQARSTLCSSCLQKARNMAKENAAKYCPGSDCVFLPLKANGRVFQIPRTSDGSSSAQVRHHLQVPFPQKEQLPCIPCPFLCGHQCVATGILPHLQRCSGPLDGNINAHKGYKVRAVSNDQQPKSTVLKSVTTPTSQIFKGVGKNCGKIQYDGRVLSAPGQGFRREVRWPKGKPGDVVKK